MKAFLWRWRVGGPLLIASLWAIATPAKGADICPYFRPDLQQPTPSVSLVEYGPARAHNVATECEVTDRKCVAQHDQNVLNLALMTGRRVICESSTEVKVCMDAVDMVNGDFVPAVDPMLTDPCTFVTRIDGKGALLYNRRLTRSRWTWNQGWKAATFIGNCDVRTMTGAAEEVAPVLPAFPWSSR